jgi:hypothetical protein
MFPLLAVTVSACISRPQNVPFQDVEVVFVEEEIPPNTEIPDIEAPIVVEIDQNVPIMSQIAVYEELLDIVWHLSEIRLNYGRMELDRAAMTANNMGDIYTLQFTGEGISGKAAPNRYFTSFELRHNHDFRLRPIVGTMMAANINIGGLMENEYYWYLQRATHWEIVNNALELYAYPSQNEEVVLRYLRY